MLQPAAFVDTLREIPRAMRDVLLKKVWREKGPKVWHLASSDIGAKQVPHPELV